jgi:tetratricopeptide (TPR) repeat protein
MYETALSLDGQNFDAASGVINSAARMGNTILAHKRADELINANAAHTVFRAGLHYLKSTVFSIEKNHAAAERELMISIDLDNNYLPAYTGYAALLMKQNRADEAIAQYQKIIELRPTAQIYTLLGMLEDSRGRSGEAESAYRKALEIAPDTAIAANNLAWLLVERQGNLDEALRLATGVVSKNPAVAGFYDTLGWIYLKKGLSSPAVEQLKRAVALEEAQVSRSGGVPNPGYRVRLGMALAKAGDRSGARREAEISLRFTDSLSQRELADARSVLAGS